MMRYWIGGIIISVNSLIISALGEADKVGLDHGETLCMASALAGSSSLNDWWRTLAIGGTNWQSYVSTARNIASGSIDGGEILNGSGHQSAASLNLIAQVLAMKTIQVVNKSSDCGESLYRFSNSTVPSATIFATPTEWKYAITDDAKNVAWTHSFIMNSGRISITHTTSVGEININLSDGEFFFWFTPASGEVGQVVVSGIIWSSFTEPLDISSSADRNRVYLDSESLKDYPHLADIYTANLPLKNNIHVGIKSGNNNGVSLGAYLRGYEVCFLKTPQNINGLVYDNQNEICYSHRDLLRGYQLISSQGTVIGLDAPPSEKKLSRFMGAATYLAAIFTNATFANWTCSTNTSSSSPSLYSGLWESAKKAQVVYEACKAASPSDAVDNSSQDINVEQTQVLTENGEIEAAYSGFDLASFCAQQANIADARCICYTAPSACRRRRLSESSTSSCSIREANTFAVTSVYHLLVSSCFTSGTGAVNEDELMECIVNTLPTVGIALLNKNCFECLSTFIHSEINQASNSVVRNACIDDPFSEACLEGIDFSNFMTCSNGYDPRYPTIQPSCSDTEIDKSISGSVYRNIIDTCVSDSTIVSNSTTLTNCVGTVLESSGLTSVSADCSLCWTDFISAVTASEFAPICVTDPTSEECVTSIAEEIVAFQQCAGFHPAMMDLKFLQNAATLDDSLSNRSAVVGFSILMSAVMIFITATLI